MFKKILVPTDGSELSRVAIEGAVDYAKTAGASLVGVSVVEPYTYTVVGEAPVVATATLSEYAEGFAKQNLAAFERAAQAAGVPVSIILTNDVNPWSAIIDTAEAQGCDAIFMASHGRRGLDALLLGSETQKVLTHTKIPVLVYR